MSEKGNFFSNVLSGEVNPPKPQTNVFGSGGGLIRNCSKGFRVVKILNPVNPLRAQSNQDMRNKGLSSTRKQP